MSVIKSLQNYLDENHIDYVQITHSPAFTAKEVANTVHVDGKEVAKTVILDVDGNRVMTVLPASHKINIDFLESRMPDKEIKLTDEKVLMELFDDCELGAMPPFGNLYHLPVFVASALSEDEEIVFNAGTHTDAIKMRYEDFVNLVHPVTINFSESMEAREPYYK